jgi:hypothetical protein
MAVAPLYAGRAPPWYLGQNDPGGIYVCIRLHLRSQEAPSILTA